MLAEKRRELILAELRKEGSVQVAELAQRFGASPLTIRRDITELADRGLLERVHGGAIATNVPREQTREVAQAGRARRVIGMVVPSMSYYWPHVIKGAQSAAHARGIRLLIRASDYNHAEDRQQITRLMDAGVQGLLLAPSTTGPGAQEMMRWISGLKIPVVLMQRSLAAALPPRAMDSLVSDHERGAASALRYLVTQGHRRVGLLITIESPSSAAVSEGFRRGAEELGLDLTDQPRASVHSFGRPGWTEALNAFLDDCETAGTTACLIHADGEAVAVAEALRDRGRSVPEDLSIIAYDDEIASIGDPPLTAVRTAKEYLGSLAVDTLLQRLTQGDQRPVHRIKLLPELIQRESVRTLEPPDNLQV